MASVPPAAAGAAGPARAPSVPPLDRVPPRLLALGLWLALVHFWMQRHLSFALLDEAEGFSIVAVLLPFLGALLELIGRKRDLKFLQTFLRRYVACVLRTRVLVTLFVAALLLGSMLSSVTVLATDLPEALEVSVRRESLSGGRGRGPAGGGTTHEPAATVRTLEAGAEALRFLRWTSPFGRAHVVAVAGYRPAAVEVYPWIGARVRVDRDLEPAPSVLVRVPLSRHALLPGGRLELWRGGEKLAESLTAALQGSALFGRGTPVDSRRSADWEHELRVAGAEGKALSAGYVAWRRPAVVTLPTDLAVGTELEARFVAASGAVEAQARFTVTPEVLHDILLVEKPR